MKTKWIAVVSRTGARVFSEVSLRLIHEMQNPLGRQKNRVMMTDKPGMGKARQASKGNLHSLTGEKFPHEETAIQFASEVNGFLKKCLNEHLFDRLQVIAEPKMMGRIRASMDKNVLRRTEWTAKDLANLSVHELRDYLHVDERPGVSRQAL